MSLSGLLESLDLHPDGAATPTGPSTVSFTASNFAEGPGQVIFGGQLLGQMVVAAARAVPDKEVKSLHTIFARGGDIGRPVAIDVEVMHAGRAFASATVSVRQGDRLCCRSLALLSAAEPDLIRHAAAMPAVPEPADAGDGWWQLAYEPGVDIMSPDAIGPAELNVWSRFPGAPADPVLNQALLAYSTDGFLIATAMRPHAGVGQSLAHVSISTSVVSHTLTFHEAVDAGSWMLLAQESSYAGRGRSYGRGHIFTEGGSLVASFVQENMIRAFADGTAPAAGEKAKY